MSATSSVPASVLDSVVLKPGASVIAFSLWASADDTSRGQAVAHLDESIGSSLDSERKFRAYLRHRYLSSASDVVSEAQRWYPGWTPIVFHDVSVPRTFLGRRLQVRSWF